MKKPIDKESVLYAFAVEANHDRGTLERYLRGYPELAEELIDLSSELRMGERLAGPRGIAISDQALRRRGKSSSGLRRSKRPAQLRSRTRSRGSKGRPLQRSPRRWMSLARF